MASKPRAVDNEYLKEIECARCDLKELIISKNCAPIMLRLAFHDAGNFNVKTKTGGANGSIRFPEELSKPANNGIEIAVNFCEEIHKKHPIVTYADLYQLAGVLAVEVTGGPKIGFVPGRVDAQTPDTVQLPNPSGDYLFLKSPDAAHLREHFSRMGFSDKDIVALSGSHTLGRAHKERSGFEGPFTVDPFSFDNSYYRELLQGDIEGVLKLPTDKTLVQDQEFKKYVQRYAQCEKTFFKEYAESHKKMSELGFKVGTHKCGCH